MRRPARATLLLAAAALLCAPVRASAQVATAVSSGTYPVGAVGVQPNFAWTGPSTTTVAGLGAGAYFLLQAANNPGFSPLAISISTPAAISTMSPVASGAYVSTYTLAVNATYYWRVSSVDGAAAQGPWSATALFTLDALPPFAPAAAFSSLSSSGGVIGEGQWSQVAPNTSIQAMIPTQDGFSGLAVSSAALRSRGDGHDDPVFTSGFGVRYSTTAGLSWIDWATAGVMTGLGGTQINALSVFNGSLYAGDNGGNIWKLTGGTWVKQTVAALAGSVNALSSFKGLLVAGSNSTGDVFYSADGANWTVGNGGVALGSRIATLQVFNDRIFAADNSASGRIYVSLDGINWSVANNGVDINGIAVLSAFNGRLFAGSNGIGPAIYVSSSGYSWSPMPFTSSDGSAGSNAMAAFGGHLYAASTGGHLYILLNGAWSPVNGGQPLGAPSPIVTGLTSAFGKFYAVENNNSGRVFVSTDGSSWVATSTPTPVTTGLIGLAPFGGSLYASDKFGSVYQLTPPPASIPAGDGALGSWALSGQIPSLAQSTTAATCGGAAPCAATNQVFFSFSDMAGNVGTAGPFAILASLYAPIAISTPSFPSGPVDRAPNFVWRGPSTATALGLGTSAYYLLQVSNAAGFAPANIVVSISTPISPAGQFPTADGAYVSTFTAAQLPPGPAYFWRVAAVDSWGQQSPWSAVASFTTDYSSPTPAAFVSVSSGGGAALESQINLSSTPLTTAQISVQDLVSGLAISTFSLAAAGDGHSGFYQSAGFGVIYSTTGGQSWIDWSTATPVAIGGAAGQIKSLAAFNGKLYAGDQSNGAIYASADGLAWGAVKAAGGLVTSLAVFNGRLFAGVGSAPMDQVFTSADGSAWSTVSFGLSHPSVSVNSLAVFNSRLFAMDNFGDVWVSTDGNAWWQGNGGAAVGSSPQSLVAFNGRLYAVETAGVNHSVYATADGNRWSTVSQNLGPNTLMAMSAYNGMLAVGDNSGNVYVSTDGATFAAAVHPFGAMQIFAFAAFNGRLYAGDGFTGGLFETVNGSTWIAAGSPSAGAHIGSLASFNGKLIAGDGSNGNGYVITPTPAILSGADGATASLTLSATALALVQSTTAAVCAGVFPCTATNQVFFAASDLAGNARFAGPFAILLDPNIAAAVSTPTFPSGNVGLQPNFSWSGPNSTTTAMLGPNGVNGATGYFLLQVSANDPGFAPGSIAAVISTGILYTPSLPASAGSYISTYTFTPGVTYYWRVAAVDYLGAQGPWSSAASFAVDSASPTASAFASLSSTGGALGETQVNHLALGVTVQMTVQDAFPGLAVSTGAFAFGGDGHDAPGSAPAFGVIYSTNAGQSWNEWTQVSTAVVGSQIRALGVFGGKLYAGDSSGPTGRVFSSADGASWSGGAIAGASQISAFAAFNGRLFAADSGNGGVYSSVNGSAWTTVNGGVSVAPGGNLFALQVFNGRLYAGGSAAALGHVYVSTSGDTWYAANGGASVGGNIRTLAAYNGRLYAGDTGNSGAIYVSNDGNLWSPTNTGFPAATAISALAVFNGRLYAGDSSSGKVYVSTDGYDWSASNVGAAVGAQIGALAAFGGRLYAGDVSNTSAGKLYDTVNGTTWVVSNLALSPASQVPALAAFNGRLFAGDQSNGDVYALKPVVASLGGADGATGPLTLSATGLNLLESPSAAVCGGAAPCAALNQVVFTASDLAGNAKFAGPFAVLADTETFPGCAVARKVGAGRVYSTIQSAVDSLPTTLPGPACVVIEDGATYGEQVTVGGFVHNGSSISIFADPATGLRPKVSPPAAATAAFVLNDSSVAVSGLDIVAANSMPYGVFATGDYAKISSVTVSTAGAAGITSAGIYLSSFSAVSYSTVTVAQANALRLAGNASFDSVSNSLFQNGGTGTNYAIWLLGGASSNTFTAIVASNTASDAFELSTNANSNAIAQSTITALVNAALTFTGASSNTVTGCAITDVPGVAAVRFLNSSVANSVSFSTMVGGNGLAAVVSASSGNVFASDFIMSPSGTGFSIMPGGDYTRVSLSTMAATSLPALTIQASSATVTQSYMGSVSNNGLQISGGGYNSISLSTMSATNTTSVYLVNDTSDALTQCFISGPVGSGLYFQASVGDTVSQSTVTSGAAYAVFFNSASSNTVTRSVISNAFNNGVGMNFSSYNTISLSSVTGGSFAGSAGLSFQPNSSYNSISQSYVADASASGIGVDMQAGAPYDAGNAISFSTAVGGLFGVHFSSCAGCAISNSYVQGSTAVYVFGSTSTTVGASVLVSTSPQGAGLQLSGGSSGLRASQDAFEGVGTGLYLDAGNSGLIVVATDVFTSGFGTDMYAATQTAGTSLWITSSTFLVNAFSAANAYGLFLNGLTSGATIQNDSFYYRGSAGSLPFVFRGMAAQSSAGLMILRNRFGDDGQVAAQATANLLELIGTPNSAVRFNDFFLNAASIANASLLRLTSGSTNAAVRDNVFFATITVSGANVSSSTLVVDLASQAGFVSNFNDFFDARGVNTALCGGVSVPLSAAWSCGAAQDANSIFVPPLWFNTQNGSEDFHPLSQQGRFNPATQAFAADAVTSPTIDAADPAEAVGAEPAPNGGVANLGSYGQTAEASQSPTQSCALARKVCKGGSCPFGSIQGALNSALAYQNARGGVLNGYACILIEDSGVYVETVTVQGFNFSGSSLAIMLDPALSIPHPQVQPPTSGAGGGAGFAIANASVTLARVDVVAVNVPALSYGVAVSSPNVALNSVNVIDAGIFAHISQAAVSISSYDSISFSSVSAQSEPAISISGAVGAGVLYSTGASQGAAGALFVNASSGTKITGSFFVGNGSPSGPAVQIANSVYTQVSLSTISASPNNFATVNNPGGIGSLWINGSSWTTVSQSNLQDTPSGAGQVLWVERGGFNVFTGDSMTGPVSGNGYLAVFYNTSSNTITGGYLTEGLGSAIYFAAGANSNGVSLTTVAAPGAGAFTTGPLVQVLGSTNTFNQVVFEDTVQTGVQFNGAAAYNSILNSTITAGALGAGTAFPAFAADNASYNSVAATRIQGLAGAAAVFDQGSAFNQISFSTMSASAFGPAAVYFNNATSNTVTSSYVQNDSTGTPAVVFTGGANGNTIALSTAANAGSYFALFLQGVSSEGVSGSVLTGGAWLDAGAAGNAIVLSTMTQTAATAPALNIQTASSNTIVQDYVYNPAGNAAQLGGGGACAGNVVAQSTLMTGGGGAAGLTMNVASFTVIAGDVIGNTSGSAVAGKTLNVVNSSSITITLSSVTSAGSGAQALSVSGSSAVAVTNSYVANVGGGIGAQVQGNSSGVSFAGDFVYSGTANDALFVNGSGALTVTQSRLQGANAVEAQLVSGLQISFSTLTGANFGSGLWDRTSSSVTLTNSYVQGSTAVWVYGSTAAALGGDTIVSVQSGATAVWMQGGSTGLQISSSVVQGGALGVGVYVDSGSAGAILLSTNTFPAGPQGAVFVVAPAAAAIWITSNTILPTLGVSTNTYGLYFSGLSAGATVQNNSIYYRAAGSLGGNTAYGIYAQGSPGLEIDHNRIDDPNVVGTLTNDGFVAVGLFGSAQAQVKFNDVNSVGANLAACYQLELANSPNAFVADNVLVNNMSPLSGACPSLGVTDAASKIGFVSDYNDVFVQNASANVGQLLAFNAHTLATWQGSPRFYDLHSLSADPLWASAAAGTEDFHVKTAALNGRFNPATGAFGIQDAATSPTIDAGDPAEPVGAEPVPNGGRVNQGSYGGGAQASKSAPPAGCTAEYTVAPGFNSNNIQTAIGNASADATSNPCVVIRSNAPYVGQYTVSSLAPNIKNLIIMGDPTMSPRASVDPGGQLDAAFVVQTGSVTVYLLDIRPTAANGVVPYGIHATGTGVAISSVNVDAGGNITAAGLAIAGGSSVAGSSVTVGNVEALIVTGQNNFVTASTFTNNSAAFGAVLFSGVARSTFTQSFARNASGDGLDLANFSNFNVISFSTMSSAGAAGNAFVASASSYNAVSNNAMSSPLGRAADIVGGAWGNAVAGSTMTSGAAAYPALFLGGGANMVSASVLSNAAGSGLLGVAGSFNAVVLSTISGGGSAPAVELQAGSSNTVSQCYVNSASSDGVRLDAFETEDAVLQSTIAAFGTGLGILSASSHTFALDNVASVNGAAVFASAASSLTFTQDSISGNSPAFFAFDMRNVSTSTLGGSYVTHPSSAAAQLSLGYNFTIQASTIVGTDPGGAALFVAGVPHLTIAQSYVQNNGAGLLPVFAASALSGSNFAAISFSTFAALGSSGGAALYTDSSFSAISQSVFLCPSGIGLNWGGTTSGNAVSGTLISGATGFLAAGAGGLTVSGDVIKASGLGAQGLRLQGGSGQSAVTASTITSAGGAAVTISLETGDSVGGSYVEGANGVVVYGATGTAVTGSVIVSTPSAGGNAVWLTAGSVGLSMSQDTVMTAFNTSGNGVFLDAYNSGAIVLSTNTFLPGPIAGVYGSTQAPGAALWITSNTFVPTVETMASGGTGGILLRGLKTGATVQNNGFYHRTPGSEGAGTAVGIYAQDSAGLRIERNRFSDPGVVTGGGYAAVLFATTTDSALRFNDVSFAMAPGAPLLVAYGFSLQASPRVVVRDNVFLSSVAVTGVNSSSATLFVDAASVPGFVSDYNDFYSSSPANTLFLNGVSYQFPWGASAGYDAHSGSAQPRWASPSPGAEDFHVLSQAGRCANPPLCTLFNGDGWTAATIDAADPAEPLGAEQAPNGGRANLGSYGGTAEASKTPSRPGASSIAAVFASSVSVAYGTVGANAYAVLASTAPDFSGVVFSSAGAAPQSALAPQGLAPNTTYFFFAQALWGDFVAQGANVSTAATLAATPGVNPPPPFVAVGTNTATVAWAPGANPLNVTTYTVVMSTSPNYAAGNAAVVVSTVPPSASVQAGFFGLNPNSTYYAFAAAVNWAGAPSPFAFLGATATFVNAPASAPVTGVTGTGLTANWGANGDPAGTTYAAQISSDNFADPAVTVSSQTFNVFAAFSGLIPSTTYWLKVQAVSVNGTPTAFVSLGSTATPANAPGALPFSAVTNGALTANWTANGNPAGTPYLAAISTDGFVTLVNSSQTLNASAAFAGLTPHTTYQARVEAIGASGSPSAFTVLGATATFTAIPSVSAFPITALSTGSVSINWGRSGNPVGTTYYAFVSLNGAVFQLFATTDVVMGFTGLTPNTTYLLGVEALDFGGLFGGSQTLGSTATYAAAPSTSALTGVTNAAITASWSANANPAGTTYYAQISTDNFTTLVASTLTFNAAATFAALTPNTTYQLRVQAQGYNGTPTAFAGFGSTTTLVNAPISLGLSSPTASSLAASWSPSGDPPGTVFVAQASSDNFAGSAPVVSSQTLNASATFFSLAPNTTYFVRVDALNAAGTPTSFTALGAAATLAALPAPVGNAFAAVATMTATVQWGSGGNPLTATTYVVAASTASDFNAFASSVTLTTAPAAGPMATLGGLKPNTTYYFGVQVLDNYGTLSPRVVLASTVTAIEAPTGVTIDDVSSTTIVAAAYAPSPAFSNLGSGVSGTNEAIFSGSFIFVGWHGEAWTTLTSTSTPARQGAGAAAAGGRVYFVGGDNGLGTVANVDVSTVGASDWGAGAALPAAIKTEAASDGSRVFAIGGTGAGGALNTVYMFDPAGAGVWTAMSAMPTARANFGLTTLGSRFLALGGANVLPNLSAAEAYDPAADRWTALTPLSSARMGPAAAAVAGKAYAIGGIDSGGATGAVEAYDPGGNVWATRTSMPTARYQAAAAAVGGKIFVLGGFNGVSYFAANQEYDPLADAWTSRAPMSTARAIMQAVVSAGRVYVTGGLNGGGVAAASEMYDPGTATLFTGLTPNTLYQFKARARNAAGAATADSPVVSTYTLAALPGAAAAALSGVGSSSFSVTWTANGNPAGTNYNLQASTASDFNPGAALTAIASTAPATFFATFSGLSPFTTYYARVQAVNVLGNPTAFVVLGSTLTLAPNLAPPPVQAVSAPSTSTLTAVWGLVQGATGYNLIASTMPAGAPIWVSSATAGIANTTATVGAPALAPNTTYYLFVQARGPNSVGPFAAFAAASTLPAPPAAAVSTYSAVGSTTASVNWSAGGNPPAITTYTVVASPSPTFAANPLNVVLTTVPAAGPSATLSGLYPNTVYYFEVQTLGNNATASSFFALGSTQTLPVVLPAPVVSAVVGASSSTLTAAWTLTAGATGYTLTASLSPSGTPVWGSSTTSGAGATTATVQSPPLAPNTPYFLFVQANGPGASGPFAAFAGTATLAGPAAAAAAPSTFSALSSSSMTVTWSVGGDPVGVTTFTVTLTTGSVYGNGFAGNVSVSTLAASAAPSVVVGGLAANATYFLFVDAANLTGGVVTAALGSTSTLAAPPQAPGVSTFTSVFITSFTAHWLAGANPVGVTTYTVQVSTDPTFAAAVITVATAPAAALSATFTGLAFGAPYYARVAAVNNNGLRSAFTSLGSTTTQLSNLVPLIVNNQTGDGVWRNAAGAALAKYNVTFADGSGTGLDRFAVMVSTVPGGTGPMLIASSDVITNINANTYATPWSLPPGVFAALMDGVTNYISVRVFNHVPDTFTITDAFYVLKDTTPPSIGNGMAGGDPVVRGSPGTLYNVASTDVVSGLGGMQYSVSLNKGLGDAALVGWTAIPLTYGATSFSTPWALNFAGLASGVTNYVSVRAWDVAGSTFQLTDAFYVLKDTAGPVVSISSPSASFLTAVGPFAGAAASPFGVQGTEVAVQQAPPGGFYWNPQTAGFTSVTPFWMPATGVSTWTFTPVPSIPYAGNTAYSVVARSSTTFNVYSANYATMTFVFDASTPTAGVQAPVPGSTVATLPVISGTAADPAPGEGLSSVAVRLVRLSDGKYWNWFSRSWGALSVSTVAAGTAAWQVTPTLELQSSLRSGASYFIDVIAADNSLPPAQSPAFVYGATFTYSNATPPAAISNLTAVPGAAPGQIKLAWNATGETGSTGIVQAGQYSIFYSTSASAVPSTTTALVFFSTANLYPGVPQSYVVPGLITGGTYFLEVALQNSDGIWSAFSNQASSVATPAPFAAIAGHVVNASTQGITAVEVDCWDKTGALAGTTFTLADGSGTWQVNNLPAGVYKLQATWTVNGITSSVWQDGIAMGSGGVDFSLEINYALATLTGTLSTLSTAGLRAAGAYGLAAYSSAAAAPAGLRPSDFPGLRPAGSDGISFVELHQRGRQVARAYVGPTGRWTLPYLLPGTYSARAFTGLSYTDFQQVTVAEGETRNVTFAVDALPDSQVYAFPNPAKSRSTIRFQTALQSPEAAIEIFDLAGDLVREIPGSEIVPAPGSGLGVYHADWDLTNSRGQAVASGVYIFYVKVKDDATGQLVKVIKKLAVVR